MQLLMKLFHSLNRSLKNSRRKVINTNGREKELKEVKSSNSSTWAKNKSSIILGDTVIKHVYGYEISKILKNCKVIIRSFLVSKV